MELHMCMKAQTDFFAWRMMEFGDICPYCKYVCVDETTQNENLKEDEF